MWFYDNVLVPLGTWAINEALPAFLDVLSGAIELLNSAIEASKDLFGWLWDSFLQPIAEWTGDVIVEALKAVADGLEKISEWIKNNQSFVEAMTIIIGSFAL